MNYSTQEAGSSQASPTIAQGNQAVAKLGVNIGYQSNPAAAMQHTSPQQHATPEMSHAVPPAIDLVHPPVSAPTKPVSIPTSSLFPQNQSVERANPRPLSQQLPPQAKPSQLTLASQRPPQVRPQPPYNPNLNLGKPAQVSIMTYSLY